MHTFVLIPVYSDVNYQQDYIQYFLPTILFTKIL